MKRCNKCGAEIDDESKFCPYCGADLNSSTLNSEKEEQCLNCGFFLKPYQKYCPNCGLDNPSYDENARMNTNENVNHSGEERNTYSNYEYAHESINMFQAYGLLFKNAFNFTGKASRQEYWLVVLMNIIITIILSIIEAITGLYVTFEYSEVLYQIGYIRSVYYVVTIIPMLSLLIRRLRDCGKSPYHIFFYLIPIAGPIMILVWLCMPSKYIYK